MLIVAEVPGLIQLFSDGSVKRFSQEISPPSPEFCSDGYKSKDIIIDSTKPITARIFHPKTPDPSTLLPVLVFFHGGGFCVCSTTWSGWTHFLGDLSVRLQVLVVSVDYRLAPENRLPVAYDDCFQSLEWLSHRNEPWLERADISHVFLSGDSAGANIAHHVAVRASQAMRTCHVEIKGLLLIHPYFGSEERIECEKVESVASFLKYSDLFWKLSLPVGSSRDHFACNFEVPENGLPEVDWSRFPAAMVLVAGLDLWKDRGVMYGEFLRKKGVRMVEVVVADGMAHAFHVHHPSSDATRVMQEQMCEFMRRF